MTDNLFTKVWTGYQNYLRQIIMPAANDQAGNMTYWHNKVFFNILIYTVPAAFVVIVPCIYVSFTMRMVVVGIAGILHFTGLLFILFTPGLSLNFRKLTFVGLSYVLAILQMYYLSRPSPGMLLLLSITVVTAIIFSPAAAYYSAVLNGFICFLFGLFIYLNIDTPALTGLTMGPWVAISLTVILLSFVCAKGLSMLLEGLYQSVADNATREIKLNKANRMLGFLGALGQNLLHVQDELSLFKNAGNIALKYGAFKMAWVLVYNEQNHSAERIIQAEEGSDIIAGFVNEPMAPNGPQEFIFTTGQYFLANNIQQSEKLKTWHVLAVKLGFDSCMILPIKKGGKVIGSLNLYAAELDFFGEEEIAMLTQAAADISYTLDYLENDKIKNALQLEVEQREIQREFDANNLNALINNTGDLMWSVDTDFNLVTCNQPFSEIIKLTTGRSLTQGTNVLAVAIDEAQSNRFKARYERAFKGEHFMEVEYMVYPEESWSEISYYPILKGDVVVGTACHWRDITERRKAARLMEASRIEIETLLNNTEESFMLLDTDLNLVSFNKTAGDRAVELRGNPLYKGMPIFELAEPKNVPSLKKMYEKILGGETAETMLRNNFGGDIELVFKNKIKPVYSSEGNINGVFVISSNVTEAEHAKEKLQQSFNALQVASETQSSILDALPHNVALLDKGGFIVAVNEAWRKFAEKKRMLPIALGVGDNYIEVCEGMKEIDLYDGIALAGGIQKVIQGLLPNFELEYRYTATDEQTWFRAEVAPLMKTSRGGAVLVLMDITAEKLAQQKIYDLNEHLEERVQLRTADLTEANKALAAFSATVSHDLRAPVRAVLGFTRIIQQEHGSAMDPDAVNMLQYITESGNRMNNIIDDLLKLAQYGEEKLKFEKVDMTLLVNGIWQNISRSTPNRATLKLEPLPEVEVDMSLMQQVVVNLLANAIKYSAKTQAPLITVWSEQAGSNTTFYFKDNGVGFDMKYYSRMFGAFQRLHSVTEFDGTGIGLTLVKKIIEKHMGTVGASGVPGEGATFYFTLPAPDVLLSIHRDELLS